MVVSIYILLICVDRRLDSIGIEVLFIVNRERKISFISIEHDT